MTRGRRGNRCWSLAGGVQFPLSRIPPDTCQEEQKTKQVDQCDHGHATRINNPEIGLVEDLNDPDDPPKTYEYAENGNLQAHDSHDPPILQWAGKMECTSFEVPTVSLHVHARIDPASIIRKCKRKRTSFARQTTLFETDRLPEIQFAGGAQVLAGAKWRSLEL